MLYSKKSSIHSKLNQSKEEALKCSNVKLNKVAVILNRNPIVRRININKRIALTSHPTICLKSSSQQITQHINQFSLQGNTVISHFSRILR